MMQTCYPSLQVYYTKFALKSQSNFEDSKKTIPICKNSWVLGFLVQEWAISHIYRYAKNIPRKYHKQKESSASGYRPLTLYKTRLFYKGEIKNETGTCKTGFPE